MQLSLPPFHQDFRFDFTKLVNVKENVQITKQVLSATLVYGNLGNANADAKAFGYDMKMEAPPLPVPGTYKFV